MIRAYGRSSVARLSTGSRQKPVSEIDQKEAILSKDVLADMAPLRARPNDRSACSTPAFRQGRCRRADEAGWIRRVATRQPAQSGCTTIKKVAEHWESELVPGTNVRFWIHKFFKPQMGTYMNKVGKVWRAFPAYLHIPCGQREPCDETNPDSAVDIYFVIGSMVDPEG